MVLCLAVAHNADGTILGVGMRAPWSASEIRLGPLLLPRPEAQAASFVSGQECAGCHNVVAVAAFVAEAAAYGSSPRRAGVWAEWRQGLG